MVLLARKDEEGNTQTLYDHLHGAGRLASGFEDEFADISRTAAVLHDVGKVAQQFQTYLLSDDGHRGDVQHARQGAFVVNDFFESKGEIEEIAKEILELAISKHHGGLPDCIDESGNRAFLLGFTESDKSNEKYAYQEIKRGLNGLALDLQSNFRGSAEDIACFLKKIKSLGMSKDSIYFYLGLLVKLIYSRLVDADRTDAACFETRKQYRPNTVDYQNDQTLAKVPLRSIEGIMCFSYKGASPALMGRCGKLGVSMAFYSPRGHYYCSVLGEENRNVLLRREQFRVADDEQKSLRYAKSFIVGKLYNAKWVLERTKRDHALRVNIDRLAEQSGKLSAALSKARKSLTIDELRGVEGLAAKDYFYAFDDLVLKNKDDFFFTSRSRRPPLDRLNALLSFCYSILTNDCIAALQGVGLDPYVGFMHTDRPGRASLALDLVEEFRPVLADRFVLTLVNTGAVKPGDFEIRENGGVLLSDFGRKKVLTAWQKKKSDQILHPFLQEKISWGLVPYVQALLLARSLRGDLDDYPPFMWK